MTAATILLVATLGVVAFFATTVIAGLIAAPWVPTRGKDVARLLALAGLKPGEHLVDLGCGDGRLVVAAARDFGARATGYELSIPMIIAARLAARSKGSAGSVRIEYGNFFKKDLRDADVVVCFLMPKAMEKLSEKFRRELKPGARIISYTFQLPGWQAEVADRPTPKDVPIYRYRV